MANFTGDAGNNSITGTDENDLIEGLGGNDFLQGLAGNDTLDGGEGDDYLAPGTGADSVIGGAGNDFLEINNRNDTADTTVIYTDSNNGTITGGFNDGTTFQDIETVRLTTGSGNDNIDLSATNVNSYLINNFASAVSAGAGNDMVKGSANGKNSLSGEAGDDSLQGGNGRANLWGGAGIDTLDGTDSDGNNSGSDNLIGGTGSDKFILGNADNIYYDDGDASTNGNFDYAFIGDFNPDEDTVQLQGSPNNYRLEVSGFYTNLFVDKAGTEPDELIARFQSVNGLDLNSDAFEYVNPINEVAFSDEGYTVNEDGTAEVTVVRTGSSTGEISITITLANGTATAPADFDNTAIPVTFADGETSKTVTIPIVDDTIFEPNETINLALTNLSSGVTLGEQSSSVLTIIDNDSPVPGTLSFNNPSYSINEDGTPIIAVRVLRSGGSDLEVSATISLSDGTAIARSEERRVGKECRSRWSPYH